MDGLADLPIGLIGNAGGIGVLTLIIVYLLRLNNQDRKDSAERLAAIELKDDARLEWLRGFYERRVEELNEHWQAEVAALRAEIKDLRARLKEAEETLLGLRP